MSIEIEVGQAANLLYGYQAVWDPSGSVPAPFFEPPTQSVETSAPIYVPPSDVQWTSTPTITLHGAAESLLSAIYNYDVAKMALDPAGIKVPAGQLALNDADSATAISAAGSFLGLDLTAGLSYMLVTMERVSGIATHPFAADAGAQDRGDYLTPAAQQVIDALTPATPPAKGSIFTDSKISKTAADSYLTAIYELGTHFVGQITEGDVLIQVFAYAEKQFKTIQQLFDNEATTQPDGTKAITGSTASSWAYNTKPYDPPYGLVAKYGKLVCLSRDPALDSAIAAGDWGNGYVPDGTPSIFAAATDFSLLTPLARNVPTAISMLPLANLITDLLIAGPYDRLVKGGLLQKYGDGIVVPLKRQLDYDWATIFPETVESWASNIVTPRIDVYQERVDLAQVKLEGGSVVAGQLKMQSFTSFSQVLQANQQPGDDPIALPSDQVTLVAQIIDTTESLITPVLTMSATALANLVVVCEEMSGTLIFEDETTGTPNSRKVALDGFLYETLPSVDPTTKRYKIDLSGVLADQPSADLISDLKQDIEFSIVAGESLLHARGTNAETVQKLEVSYLLWLASIIPADTTDIDLAQNRARALYLARNVATFGSDVVYVPYVTYETYTKYVRDLTTQAGTLNTQIGQYQIQITDTVNAYQEMTDIAAVNANIKAIGGVLVNYFKALKDGREAMNGYYDAIIAQLDKELQTTLADISTLKAKLEVQQTAISHAGNPPGIIQIFIGDYSDYVNDKFAQALVSGVEALFSLGLSMAAVPEAGAKSVLDALKAIKEVVDQLQAVMKVLQQLEAIEKAVGDISKINELASSITALGENGTLKMPSQVDMQQIGFNVTAALTEVPDGGKLPQDKANLIAAVKSLVVIGSAMVQAQAKASQILVQIAQNTRLKTINGQQEAALSALENSLHLGSVSTPPDINSINLIGVSGQLQYQLKQVLTVLAQTLELQDGALQYEYFGDPTPIISFTLQNLQNVITTQDSNIINAIAQLKPPPQKVTEPIKVSVGPVAWTKLSGTNVFPFQIQLNQAEFSTYDMVRIDRVVANVTGIKSPTTGKYEVHLTCQAKPFQDRNYQRQAYTYASALQKYGPFVYDEGGQLENAGSVGSIDDKITKLTPFSTWQISLPNDVANNQGVEADGVTVGVELEFYITAHYDDPSVPKAAAPVGMMSMQGVEEDAEVERSAAAAADTAAAPADPSLANLELEMYNRSVMQNWDAVFSILSGPTNAFLNYQFQQYIKDITPNSTTGLMHVSAYYCQGVTPVRGGGYQTNVTQMKFALSNPLLQFDAGTDTVTVLQDILSGSVKTGSLLCTQDFTAQNCNLIDGDINFTATTTTPELTLSIGNVFEVGMQVFLTSTEKLPAPFLTGTSTTGKQYWIVSITPATSKTKETVTLSETAGGAAITPTDAGTGTQTMVPAVFWGDPSTVVITDHPYVQGSVALSAISGVVKPPSGKSDETHTVFLDFPSGSFTLKKLTVQPPNWDPSHGATSISNALANFFATNEIKYHVQSINYSKLSKDPNLLPTKYVLNAMNTNAGNNVLQMLIATTGEIQHAHTTLLTEPIPYNPAGPVPGSSDFTAALMINTKLMWNNIFVDSFNTGGTNIEVAAIDPEHDFFAWSAQVVKGSATSVIPWQNPYEVKDHGTDIKTNFRISASSNSLTWDLTGLTFKVSQADGIALNYTNGTAQPPTGGTSVAFQYQQWYSATQYTPAHWGPWQDATAICYINMNGSYPLAVSGEGSAQEVTFTTIDPKVEMSGSDLVPATGCHSNDNAIKNALINALATTVPGVLSEYIGKITFSPISVFALENLLFPADQLISMGVASVPGDLLVVGGYLTKVRKKNPTYDITISAAAGASGKLGSTTFENGKGTGSASQTGVGSKITFQYGATGGAGGLTTYNIDIDTGTVSPPLMILVDQPDPVNSPATVILLPPGFVTPTS